METTASPTKRRVLGQLDPNASPRPVRLDAKQAAHTAAPSSPLKKVTVFPVSPSGNPEQQPKRNLLFGEVAGSEQLHHPAKRVCREDISRRDMAVQQGSRQKMDQHDQANAPPATDRRVSASPEPSSFFDTSVVDTSQATTITEPDLVAVTAAAAAAATTLGPVPRPATRPRLTREEAREKAEILKLRLGLASYKLRTGQTDVPLEQLEEQSAAASIRHKRVSSSSRNGAGWASARLQAQLQLQRAQIAAATTTEPASDKSARRPLPGTAAAPALRRLSSEDDVVNADRSFSSQVQWSQGSSSQEEAALGDARGGDWDQRTPRRQRFEGVEVEEEQRLTSSALRGGAASGLLSLANARS